MKTHEAIPSRTRVNRDLWTLEVYRNYPQGKLTVTDLGSTMQWDFLYEEPIPVIQWNIQKEEQTILGYKCKKATGQFRGRDYVAWFSADIPLPYGPWKFGGLPGLILKLNDTKDNFVYTCNGIQKLKEPEPIKFYKVNYIRVTRQNLIKQCKRYAKNFRRYVTETKSRVWCQTLEAPVLPYNPIELE